MPSTQNSFPEFDMHGSIRYIPYLAVYQHLLSTISIEIGLVAGNRMEGQPEQEHTLEYELLLQQTRAPYDRCQSAHHVHALRVRGHVQQAPRIDPFSSISSCKIYARIDRRSECQREGG